jgi:hypothetical protein
MLLALALTLGLAPFQQTPPPTPQTPPSKHVPTVSPQKRENPSDVNADIIKAFVRRVDTYVALHKKLEATLPPLPKQTDPTVIDHHERALATLIQNARRGAKQGDLFDAQMQDLVRRLLQPIFAGTDGAHVRTEILDNEYKGDVKLSPNGRYPDEIPVSTVPPQVLQHLPKLPEEMEYRFVRQNLILFDPHAHVIPDWVPMAFK